MGWKAFSVLIKPFGDISNEIILQTLGYTNCAQLADEPYEIALYPDTGKVYIGKYNDVLIVSELHLPDKFFTDGLSETEKKLIDLFPHAEICAVALHSGVNYWGYAIIKNGKKIRARMGDSDHGTVLDYGDPLGEELELLSKSKLDGDGQRFYFFEDNQDEPFTEHQVGENFVFEIYRRYTGESLDADDNLFEATMNCYRFSKQKTTFSPVQPQQNVLPKNNKPWWRFW